MGIKTLIPAITDRVKRVRHRRTLMEFDSFESALAASDTYEDPALVEVVSRKTKAFRATLFSSMGNTVRTRQIVQNMFVLSYVEPGRPLDILELGGACGASYFELNRLLPDKIKSWSVVETPAMAAAGRSQFQDDRIRFFDDLEAATVAGKSFDLIVAQGVMQYLSDPLRMLDCLFALRCKYLYVARTAVRVGEDDREQGAIFTRQVTDLSEHGPGALPQGLANHPSTQPLVLIRHEAIASRLPADYRLLFWFDESEESTALIGSKLITTREVGFLAHKENL